MNIWTNIKDLKVNDRIKFSGIGESGEHFAFEQKIVYINLADKTVTTDNHLTIRGTGAHGEFFRTAL